MVKFKSGFKRSIGEESSSEMSASSDLLSAPREFLNLFNAGKEAARKGHKSKAHKLFRQAAEVDPYHEMVWLWLASVVETEEDRRVCFENVLELNPSNITARRQLQQIEQKALIEVMHPEMVRRMSPPLWQRMVRLALMFVIIVAILITAWLSIFA
jgi:thioredoxin-like negative regulator of GroEL